MGGLSEHAKRPEEGEGERAEERSAEHDTDGDWCAFLIDFDHGRDLSRRTRISA
jgi:hypothetical protein